MIRTLAPVGRLASLLGMLGLAMLAGCQHPNAARCDDGGICPAGMQCVSGGPGQRMCAPLLCGNGVVDPGEACDDGNNTSGDGCTSYCGRPCGDRVRDPDEACDDGNTVDGDGCAADCRSTETCGNGVVDPGEQCDDGNPTSHDGCSGRCNVEQPRWASLEDAPMRRAGHAMAYDATRGMIVLFGGLQDSAPTSDTWEWDGVAWRPRASVTVPPARAGHAMAYDVARRRIVMFGGGEPTENGTWEWDGANWLERVPAVTAPPQLTGAAMAYDAGRQRIVLFGGSLAGAPQSKTWAWDGAAWQELAQGAPPARDGHTMAYDSRRGTIVLFGGVAGEQRLGDTWELDATGWSERSPSTAPRARAHAAMVFDIARGRIALFGGDDGGTAPGMDAWEWDGTLWSPRAVADAPQARASLAAAHDAARGRTLLFGGQRHFGGALDQGMLGDTWDWDGARWTPRALATAIPTSRIAYGAAYDPARGAVVLFGGNGPTNTPLSDTWEWDGVQWVQDTSSNPPTARSSTAIASDGAHVMMFGGASVPDSFIVPLADTWVLNGSQWRLQPLQASPGARWSHAMAHDVARGRVVLFGGISSEVEALGDTWLWDGTHWTPTQPAHIPPARARHALAYDSARHRVMMFGGTDLSSRFSDLWAWDGTDWLDVTPPTAPPRPRDPVMAFDAARDQLVLFMGDQGIAGETWEWDGVDWQQRRPTTVPMPGAPTLVYDPRIGRVVMLDVANPFATPVRSWEWDGVDWSEQVLVTQRPSAQLPSARFAPMLVYDEARANIVLFGGSRPNVGSVNDTWTWDGVRWQQRSPSLQPSPLHDRAMVYDRARSRAVLFGGTGFFGEETTWEWDGEDWHAMQPATSPPVQHDFVMVYDAAVGKTLLFGGLVTYNDPLVLWAWDGATWNQIPSTTPPGARTRMAATYDAARQRLVMFGGENQDGPVNEIWEWDGTAWSNRTPASGGASPPAPAPRSGAQLVYDTMYRRVVLFGGAGKHTGDSSNLMTDAWTWDGQRWTQLSLPRSPSPRASAGLACDQARGELLLFGGVVFDGFSSKALQDIWSLRTDDPAAADEQCHTGFDGNDDGKIGCDDADCMAVCARCGDGVCDASESCRSCPVDCGVCAVCGDFHCDPGETCASCPGDCRCSTGAP